MQSQLLCLCIVKTVCGFHSAYSDHYVCRSKSKASRKISFEDNSQTFSISSLTEKSMEDASISLQVGSQDFSSKLLLMCLLQMSPYQDLRVHVVIFTTIHLEKELANKCSCHFIKQ